MDRQLLLSVPAIASSPEFRLYANPAVGLYHWLRALGSEESSSIPTEVTGSVSTIHRALAPFGVRGIHGSWEQALADASTTQDAWQGYEDAVTATGQAVRSALSEAAPHYEHVVWPGHLRRIEQAIRSLEGDIFEALPLMIADQSRVLDLEWPIVVEITLVGAMAGRAGAFSHPLTIDVSRLDRFDLAETIVHESTHVADVNSIVLGRHTFGQHVVAECAKFPAPLGSWQVWHAMIFAASAFRIRSTLDSGYEDYATVKGLYEVFGVPRMRGIWAQFEVDRDVSCLINSVKQDLQRKP